jgi:hypothetical protein
MKNVSKRIEFGNIACHGLLLPVKWFLDEVEVTEMEYYGITPQTTIEDIGEEPADMLDYQEWLMKRSLIRHRDKLDFFLF